ncbi:response regulator transcription factor [Arsenicitalea aurantiaca]|uniref:response regulator transcription factor n=1 Tax=Arsenicitalea aurantiaca TaxID=1783274 RepID=UPI001315790D|nr:LuxR C-terminal-related transcriptional regulator [Arsenicitalea aurantiaca]
MNRDRLLHIVDADARSCERLNMLFRLEGFQTAISFDLAGLYAGFDRRRPDVVLLNMQVGEESGLEALKQIKAMRTGTPVFMIAESPQVALVVEAMRAGAADIINKPFDEEGVLRAVREELRRDIHMGVVASGRRSIEVRGFSQLTPREREVLQLITNGQSNKEAGRQLGISPRTIEVHRARVMEKLGARNTADLMRIVLTS